MIVIDVSSMMTVIDNEIWLKYSLRRCVDAVIDLRRKNNIVDGCMDFSSIFSRITVVDNEIWSKYSLRRCPETVLKSANPLRKPQSVVIAYSLLFIDF